MTARTLSMAVALALALGIAIAISPARAERLIVSVSNHRVTVTRWFDTETISRSAAAPVTSKTVPSPSTRPIVAMRPAAVIRCLRSREW